MQRPARELSSFSLIAGAEDTEVSLPLIAELLKQTEKQKIKLQGLSQKRELG